MKPLVFIAIYLLVYVIVYILIQRKLRFSNIFAQLVLAIGLFFSFELGYALIKTAKQDVFNKPADDLVEFSHFETDSFLPAALNPQDTGYKDLMGQHKSRLERKVDFIPQYVIDSSANTILICCYGGSSTYCVGLRSETSWPSVLQKQLTDSGYHVLVHNHGIPGHNIRDAFYNLIHYPCAKDIAYKQRIQLHYHGWNDIRMMNLPFIKEDNAMFSKSTEWHIETNKLMTSLMPVTPKSELYNFYFFRSQHLVPFKNQLNLIKKTCVINYLYQKLLQFKLNELIKTYQERMILSSDTNITATQYLRHNFRGYFSTYTGEINYLSTKDPQSGNSILFIPQILNYPMLETQKGETFSYWMPGVSEQFACIMTKDINNLLAHMYPQHTEMYNQVQTGWQEEDFLDNGHFSIAGSHKFADKILPGVITIINNNQAGKHK